MRAFRIHISVLAFAVSGCVEVGGLDQFNLPAADATLPAEYDAGGPGAGTMDDYFATGGTWRVDLDGHVQTVQLGSRTITDAMVYDTVNDEWTINVASTNFVLTDLGFGGVFTAPAVYESACPPGATSCAQFIPFDDAASQYGTFGYVIYADVSALVEYFVHAGLKTPSASMPAGGTGTYAGTLWGVVNSMSIVPGFDYVEGSADINATFAPGGGTLTFASTGAGTDGTYTLNGNATITGNTYAGTVSGSYTETATATVVVFGTAGSTLSGAFYGPDQVTAGVSETAGVLYTGDATDEFAGGFWSKQTGYTP